MDIFIALNDERSSIVNVGEAIEISKELDTAKYIPAEFGYGFYIIYKNQKCGQYFYRTAHDLDVDYNIIMIALGFKQ